MAAGEDEEHGPGQKSESRSGRVKIINMDENFVETMVSSSKSRLFTYSEVFQTYYCTCKARRSINPIFSNILAKCSQEIETRRPM